MGTENEKRAKWASQALFAFGAYDPDNDYYTNVKDLVADLGHYLMMLGMSQLDIEACILSGLSFFKEEVVDDE